LDATGPFVSFVSFVVKRTSRLTQAPPFYKAGATVDGVDMKTLGLLGGMSSESTAIYYRLLNEGVNARLGGLSAAKLILWSFDFADIAARQSAGDWDGLAASLAEAARRLEAAGAEAVMICANTMHKMADEVQAAIGVPVLHIADATAQAIKTTPSRRPAFLATRYSMEQDFIRGRLRERFDIETLIPDEPARIELHRIIYDELCLGVVKPESKAAFRGMVDALRRQGADGVILGCTELGLVLTQAEIDLPVFDTALIHVTAGVDFALR
jgi:aspartate racemase